MEEKCTEKKGETLWEDGRMTAILAGEDAPRLGELSEKLRPMQRASKREIQN